MLTLDEIKNIPTEFLKTINWDITFKNGKKFEESNKILHVIVDKYIIEDNKLSVFFNIPDCKLTGTILRSLFYTEEITISHRNPKDEAGFDLVLVVRQPRISTGADGEKTDTLRAKVSYEIVGERIA